MTKLKILAVAAVTASVALLGAAPARAQTAAHGFGQNGQMILSADRMFGLTFTSTKVVDGRTPPPMNAGTTTSSRTNVSLLWPTSTGPSPNGANGTITPYQIPRVGFDVVVASRITVGGSIGYFSQSGKNNTEPASGAASTEQDATSLSAFLFSPRIGYALPLSPLIAFWPRLGVTYYRVKVENPVPGAMMTTTIDTLTTDGWGFDLEPMFVFTPVYNFGITVGPTLDLPLAGTTTRETTPAPMNPRPDDSVKITSYGLAVGLLGYF